MCRIKFVLATFVEGHPLIISNKLLRILTTGFRGEIFENLPNRDKPRPLVAMFFFGGRGGCSSNSFSLFVEGHLITISAISFSFLTNSSEAKMFKVCGHVYDGSNSFSYFSLRSSSDHFY